MKKRLLLTSVTLVALVATAALAYFEPWRAFTSSTLDEALPVSSALAAPASATSAPASPPAAPVNPSAPSAEPAGEPASSRSPEAVGADPAEPTSPRTTDPRPTPAPAPPVEKPVDRILSEGTFVDAEYETDGVAKIIELADGRRFLRIEGLSTSDGPDVHVWLSEATAGGSWGKYDDNGYVKLGKLKATNGNLNYEIPAGADISTMRSAVIWCDRFNVAFGAAPVSLAG